jgi:hypothetical protein
MPPASRKIGWFKAARVGVLLVLLLIVAVTAWQDGYRSTRWREPLFVAVYPIAADDSALTHAYLDGLDARQFKDIDHFFGREAARYHLAIEEPFRTRLQPQLGQRPPERNPQAGPLGTAVWSLRLRYWAWKVSRHAHEPADIRMFVLFADPAITPTVPHSLGLTKGLIGVVYAFAAPSMSDENNVIISHEMLHTVGATDKYRVGDDAPSFPDGYGDPRQNPLYPQKTAELMAGRRMLDASHWEQAASLEDVVIGSATALEIRWPQHAR